MRPERDVSGTDVDAEVDADVEVGVDVVIDGGGAHCDAAGGGEKGVVLPTGALEEDGGADIAGKKHSFKRSTETVHGLPDLDTKKVFSDLCRTSNGPE